MSIAYSFAKDNREFSGGRTDSPGPNNYDPEKSMRVVKEMSPEWSPEAGDQNPGPGQYDGDVNKLKHNLSYSIGGKASKQTPLKSDKLKVPGPGSYDPTALNKPPSFSIGGKRKDQRPSQVPGPGQYDIASNNSVRGSANLHSSPFGIVSKRDSQGTYASGKKQREFSPGPGAYEPNVDAVKYKNPTYGINKGQKGITSKDILPGPGQYDGLSKEMGKSLQNVTIKSRPKTAKIQQTPGPGQYSVDNRTIDQDLKSQRGASTLKNKSERLQSLNRDQVQNPGPGQYDANLSVIKDRVKQTPISRTGRSSIVPKEETYKPGPGNYDIPHNKSVQSFKIGSKIKDSIKNTVPGPGNYDPNTNAVKDSIRNVKIPFHNKSMLQHSKSSILTPGPGQYDRGNDFGKNVPSVSIRGRPKDQQEKNIPGPGQYDPNDYFSKERVPTATIKPGGGREKNQMFQTSNNVGPGQYDDKSKDFGKDVKSFKFQSKPEQKIDDKPGPGQYDPNPNNVKDSLRSVKLSKSQRPEMTSKEVKNLPGPGNYESYKQFGKDVPMVSIMGKREPLKKDNIPGPGSYNNVNEIQRDKSPSFRIGTSKRHDIVDKNANLNPGPGNYDAHSTIGANGPKFTFQPKNEQLIKDQSPGPVAYEPNVNYIKDNLRGFQIGKSQRQDIVSKEVKELPGPGGYDTPMKTVGPQYTMGGRSKSRTDMMPGPGQYEQSIDAVRDKSPAFAISKTMRSSIVNKSMADLPGPGNYANNDDFGKDVQTFSIRGKPNDTKPNLVPGPGQYQSDISPIKDRTVGYKISKSNRQDIVSKEMIYQPGPGEYDSPKRFGEDAQSITIRGKPKDKVGNGVPGPGNYDPENHLTKDQALTSFKMPRTERSQMVSKEEIQKPGPGQYQSTKNFGDDAKSVQIRGRPKDIVGNDIPGPGNYNNDDSHLRYQSPAVKIDPKSKRGDIVDREQLSLPGPGNYDQHSGLGKGQAATIRGKPADQKDNGQPGPGHYDASADVVRDNARSYRMPKTKRDFLDVSDEQMQLPGPGQYDLHKSNSGPAYTIKGRDPAKNDNGIPGPGAYDKSEDNIRFKQPAFDFSRSPDRSLSPDKDTNPGPGQYDDRDYYISGHSVIVYSIPKGEIKDPKNDTPGPGYYKIPVKFADTNAYSGIRGNEEFRYV
ncbi:UNKNOWN [Stylonychia lemnae]|uniref:Uncharacterized protein n=1 Tax=Stylonychia lemnae TaxID=5949 RepID=A0A078ACE4_STYLE|nr:UNKNOWN [Stylonychia lemnae]|eukprot:CDW79521.1 UNKNOWN [Stylonychia lemnae]